MKWYRTRMCLLRPCTVDGFSTIANAAWLSARTSVGPATGTPVMNSTKSRTKMTAWPTLDIATYSASVIGGGSDLPTIAYEK